MEKKYSSQNVTATFMEGEGEAFEMKLRLEIAPGKYSDGITIAFKNEGEMKGLANYLLDLAHELKAQKEVMPFERVRCGSCAWYGITDSGFGMCRLHAGRVASDSCICNDYK